MSAHAGPHPYWPLFDLRVRTPRLEIRLPTDDDVVALVRVVDTHGIHDPAMMPFQIPFTDTPPPRRQRESMQWFWRCRAEWSPTSWKFSGAVVVDGEVVGLQDLMATDFPVLRSVNTGSWLGRHAQGKGIGKEMRAAILHLAFAGLGAREAHSGAFFDNAASAATSRSLGYVDNGVDPAKQRSAAASVQRFLLTRERWESRRRDDITIEGLEGCREMFGA
jgi:RimJ/RimL family protein N-acetyltransferase